MIESKSVHDYAVIVWRRRGLVLVLAALVTAAGYGLSFLQQPVYESYAEFYHAGPLIPMGVYTGIAPELWAIRNVHYPSTLQERKFSYEGLLASGEVQRRVHARVPEKPVSELASDVEVNASRNHMLFVRSRDHSPQIAARVASAYAQALDDFLSENALPAQQKWLASAEVSLAQARKALASARGELVDFLEAAGSPDLKKSLYQNSARRITAVQDLDQAHTALRSVQSRIAAAEERLRDGSRWIPPGAAAGARPRELPGPRERELEAGITRTQKRAGSRTQEGLEEQMRRDIVEAYLEHRGLQAAIAEGERALRDVEAEAGAFPDKILSEALLIARVQRLQRMVEHAEYFYEEVRAQLIPRPSHMVSVAEGWPAQRPLLPDPRANAVFAGVLGLLIGVYAACAAEAVSELRGARKSA